MKWTRIADTELAIKAWEILDVSDCQYHNGLHVMKMYEYLAETNEPYNECLDWAVLFHDIVYDNKPNKELRSARLFSEMKAKYGGFELDLLDEGHVTSLILATEHHVVYRKCDSAIIRADLHGLTNPVSLVYKDIGV